MELVGERHLLFRRALAADVVQDVLQVARAEECLIGNVAERLRHAGKSKHLPALVLLRSSTAWAVGPVMSVSVYRKPCMRLSPYTADDGTKAPSVSMR